MSLFQSLGAWIAEPTIIQADRRPITDHYVVHLVLLPQIEHLTLGETAITDAAMPVIGALHRLTLLDICGTRATDNGAAHLAALTKLRCLGIAGSSIGDATTCLLRGLARIEMLNANQTSITDVGLTDLSTLTNLRAIQIRHTRTTREGIEKFREKLPACIIVTDEEVLRPLA